MIKKILFKNVLIFFLSVCHYLKYSKINVNLLKHERTNNPDNPKQFCSITASLLTMLQNKDFTRNRKRNRDIFVKRYKLTFFYSYFFYSEIESIYSVLIFKNERNKYF